MKNENRYKTGQFARLIGVHFMTLQRWDRERKLIAFRTKTDRRYYTDAHYQMVIEQRKQQHG